MILDIGPLRCWQLIAVVGIDGLHRQTRASVNLSMKFPGNQQQATDVLFAGIALPYVRHDWGCVRFDQIAADEIDQDFLTWTVHHHSPVTGLDGP